MKEVRAKLRKEVVWTTRIKLQMKLLRRKTRSMKMVRMMTSSLNIPMLMKDRKSLLNKTTKMTRRTSLDQTMKTTSLRMGRWKLKRMK